MKPIRLAAAAALLACATGISVAQEMFPNPEFPSWSKFPKGTTVIYKMLDENNRLERKLLQVDANKIVLESTQISKIDGKEMRFSGKEEEILKTARRPFVAVQPWMFGKGKAPAGWTAGEEKRKIGDTEVKTRWYSQFDPKSGVGAKVWVSEEVPGFVVKIETTLPNPATKKPLTQIPLEVIEVKKASSKP